MCSCFIEFIIINKLGKRDKMGGAQMLDSSYHMTLNLLKLKINNQVFHRPLFETRGP